MINIGHSLNGLHTMSNNHGIYRPFEGLSDDDWIDDAVLARHLNRSVQTTRRYLDAPDGIPHTRIGPKRIINVGIARDHLLKIGRRPGSNAA
jgi:hypothetical protein